MLLNTSNSPNTTLSARITGALTIAGGAAFAALAALEITHPHIHATAVKTPAEHAILAPRAFGLRSASVPFPQARRKGAA